MNIDYNLFVPKYYQMNPKHEDILFDGEELQNGMIVLVESSDWRMVISQDLESDGESLELAMCRNRWMRIHHLVIREEVVQFIAEYADKSKKKVSFPLHLSWLVMNQPVRDETSSTKVVDPPIDLREPEEKVVGTAPVKPWTAVSYDGADEDLREDYDRVRPAPARETPPWFEEVKEDFETRNETQI